MKKYNETVEKMKIKFEKYVKSLNIILESLRYEYEKVPKLTQKAVFSKKIEHYSEELKNTKEIIEFFESCLKN